MAMRSREFWYDKLPEDIKKKAVFNTRNYEDKKDEKYLSLRNCLKFSFTWANTEEGMMYWAAVATKY